MLHAVSIGQLLYGKEESKELDNEAHRRDAMGKCKQTPRSRRTLGI